MSPAIRELVELLARAAYEQLREEPKRQANHDELLERRPAA